MKKLFNSIKAVFLWLYLWAAKRWLKIRLRYYVRWIGRASVRDKCIYYILLNPNTREVLVCDGNEYANIKRNLRKKNKVKSGQYVYAKANPWEHNE